MRGLLRMIRGRGAGGDDRAERALALAEIASGAPVDRLIAGALGDALHSVARAEARNRQAALAAVNAVEIGDVRRACEGFATTGDDVEDVVRARRLVRRAKAAYARADASARGIPLPTAESIGRVLGMRGRRS